MYEQPASRWPCAAYLGQGERNEEHEDRADVLGNYRWVVESVRNVVYAASADDRDSIYPAPEKTLLWKA
jgi:alkyl sulfatase BDS1-like metallo-beta-lactamase superfamily hydrolase